jgi:hypothetical protein
MQFAYVKAQPGEQWGSLEPGPFSIGYEDTTLWLDTDTYQFSKYAGPRPLAIGIWYPAQSGFGSMPFGEYLRFPSMRNKQLEGHLAQSMRHVIERDLFGPELPDSMKEDAVAYADSLFSMRVPTGRGLPLPERRLSTVIYFHGAQSVHFDNNVMCEYLASKGNVVISALCNWPTDEFPDRLTSTPSTTSEPLLDIERLMRFSVSLPHVDSTRLLAVGHSLGAQKLIRYDEFGAYRPYHQIVSLHTTLEAFNADKCVEYWPEFRYLIEGKVVSARTPTILLAPYVEDYYGNLSLPAFEAFRQNSVTPYRLVVPTTPMSHNGFISWENWLLHVGPEHRQPSGFSMAQSHAYHSILKLVSQLLDGDGSLLEDKTFFKTIEQ